MNPQQWCLALLVRVGYYKDPEPVPSSPVKGTSMSGQGPSWGLDVQSHAPVSKAAHTSQPRSLSDVPGHVQNALMQAPGTWHLSPRSESQFWCNFLHVPKKPAQTQHYLISGTAIGSTVLLFWVPKLPGSPGKCPILCSSGLDLCGTYETFYLMITSTSHLCSPFFRVNLLLAPHTSVNPSVYFLSSQVFCTF